MFSTLILTALAMTQEQDLTPLIQPGNTYSYDLKVQSSQVSMVLQIDFEVAILEETDKGFKAAVAVTGTNQDRGIEEQMEPMIMTLDRRGIPIDGEHFEKAGLIVYVALMTTLMPARSLEKGDTYNFERTTTEFSYKGSGAFKDTREVDGLQFAVVTTSAIAAPTSFAATELETEALFDFKSKRVVQTKSKMSGDGSTMQLTLKLKSVKTERNYMNTIWDNNSPNRC